MKKATTTQSAPTDEMTVTRETLETTPARVLELLRGIGTSPSIRATMMAHGYTGKDQDEGWRLLRAASGSADKPDRLAEADPTVRDAIRGIDADDEKAFRIVRAALSRLHPAQADFVLRGIGPAQGAASVLGMGTLLERLDQLENGADRKATRKADQAALETLAKRGIDKAARERYAQLIKTAMSAPDVIPPDEEAAAVRDKEYLAALTALRAWYDDWAEMARALITRRDHLIRVGMAKRKSQGKGKKAVAKEGASQQPLE